MQRILSEQLANFKILSRLSELVFIPPRAHHFGGLWEAAVKVAKHLLIRAIGCALLSKDELDTIVVEVEAILNTRPIVAVTTNPNDIQAITPANILAGRTLGALPPVSVQRVNDDKLSYLSRWRLVSAIKERFCTSWLREYLLSLQQKQKWTKDQHNLVEGTIVLIHEDNIPSQAWMLGVVTKVFPGSDGKVRVAEVKTKSNYVKRAIHRLAPLPIN
ncbi:uncharacterized protein [Drosophila takahashii]|uniref:uncharacterized protein n=1 Tax=Drosophila takahashii TaxID=29030 RepID=UPI0038994283